MRPVFPLEADLGTFIILTFFLMIGMPIILIIAGAILNYRKKKKTSKVLFIIAGVWALISLGACGFMMGGGF